MAEMPATGRRFAKMHGAGNDFVVIDLRDGTPAPDAALCRLFGDRHRGVGCDQILTVEPPRAAGSVASYRIWNSDASPSQQCGNGARCIAAWLVRDGAAPKGGQFLLDSPVGTHAVTDLGEGRFEVVMGVPDFEPSHVPLRGFDQAQETYALEVGGALQFFGAVSMGNPHAVLEVPDTATADVATLGPALQAQPAFPESANIGFAQVEAFDRIRLRVYERGAGETLACGSGACAAAAVLMRRGRIARDVVVALPGGELRIRWPEYDAPLAMAGPTAFVFEGQLTEYATP
ncbi:diaminopimelate epimerase [Lysobacter ruishenii]|uniref:Diaminopimelate epimerase n=2 Tax=Aerolutibacter ruishenii TaxID=686800 RepID=A0A562M396_9GAMM|nr:diaminopimelate epimerase [Lysobacter ruishenii]